MNIITKRPYLRTTPAVVTLMLSTLDHWIDSGKKCTNMSYFGPGAKQTNKNKHIKDKNKQANKQNKTKPLVLYIIIIFCFFFMSTLSCKSLVSQSCTGTGDKCTGRNFFSHPSLGLRNVSKLVVPLWKSILQNKVVRWIKKNHMHENNFLTRQTIYYTNE